MSYPYVTRIGQFNKPYLAIFYDLNCPFCVQHIIENWEFIASTGKYVEFVYFPVYFVMLSGIENKMASFLINTLPYCVDNDEERLKLFVKMAEKYREAGGDFRKILAEQLRVILSRVDVSCIEKFGRYKDPEEAYDGAVEYAKSLGVFISGVPTAVLVGDNVEMYHGADINKAVRKIYGSKYDKIDLQELVKKFLTQ